MCTVTFIPAGGRVFIASNRDEQRSRATGLQPAPHHLNGMEACYVTDNVAGGTWCGMNAAGHVLVLLNGAAEKHISRPPYRVSRGVLMKTLLHTSNPVDMLAQLDTEGVEPFTIVLYNGEALHQFRWNGREKELLLLNALVPHIWSSATLYTPQVQAEKERRLQRWTGRETVTAAAVQSLHLDMQYAVDVPAAHQVPGMATVSISVFEYDGQRVFMHHHPLIAAAATVTVKSIIIQKQAAHVC